MGLQSKETTTVCASCREELCNGVCVPCAVQETQRLREVGEWDELVEWLGRVVREVWIDFARTSMSNAKPSWTAPWEEVPAHVRDVDRRIGEVLFLISSRAKGH